MTALKVCVTAESVITASVDSVGRLITPLLFVTFTEPVDSVSAQNIAQLRYQRHLSHFGLSPIGQLHGDLDHVVS